MSVALGGLELPPRHGFDGLLIEAQSQAAQDPQTMRLPVFADLDRQEHGSLVLGLARLLGKFGLHFVEHARGRDASGKCHGEAAAIFVAVARAFVATDAAVRAAADSATVAW